MSRSKHLIVNLPYGVPFSDEDIRSLFTGKAEIKALKVARDQDTGNCRGAGLIWPKTDHDYKAMFAMSGTKFSWGYMYVHEPKPLSKVKVTYSGARPALVGA